MELINDDERVVATVHGDLTVYTDGEGIKGWRGSLIASKGQLSVDPIPAGESSFVLNVPGMGRAQALVSRVAGIDDSAWRAMVAGAGEPPFWPDLSGYTENELIERWEELRYPPPSSSGPPFPRWEIDTALERAIEAELHKRGWALRDEVDWYVPGAE